MKTPVIAAALLIGLASGSAMAQSNKDRTGPTTNSGYDWATARSYPATTEGTYTAFSRNSVLQNHLPGVARGNQCVVQTRRLLEKLTKEDYRGAQKAFAPSVRKFVTPDRLAQMSSSLEAAYGQPSKTSAKGTLIDSPTGGYSVVALGLAYPKAALTAHVMCDIHNRITDFKVTQDEQVASR